MSNTSSWTLNNKEVSFVPAPYSAVPPMIKGDLREAFDIILENKEAVKKSTIPVEKINGSILLMSAIKDEQWASTEMSNKVMERLESNRFKHHYEHIPINGGHTDSYKHFDLVYDFLEKYFKNQ
jgi:hypothetical protein